VRDCAGAYAEGARSALEARTDVGAQMRGPLAHDVEVTDRRFLLALESYLDLSLHALLTSDIGEARSIMEFWRERAHTGAVWPLGEAGANGRPEIGPQAREHVLCTGTEAARLKGDLDRHREALLGRLLLTRDLEQAIALRRTLNAEGTGGWYVVAALTGEVLEPSGVLRLPPRRGEANGLERLQQAEDLRALLLRLAAESEQVENRVRDMRRLLALALDEESAAQARAAKRTAELDDVRREIDLLTAARDAARERASDLVSQLEGLDRRLQSDSAKADELGSRVDQLQRQLEAAEGERIRFDAELEQARVERESALRELAAAELSAEQRGAALQSVEREERYLAESEAEQAALGAGKQAQAARERETAASLECEATRIATQGEEVSELIQRLRGDLRALEEDTRALEAERSARDAEAKALRAAHDEARQELHREEMRRADLVHRRQSIHTVIETEFGQPLEALSARLEEEGSSAVEGRTGRPQSSPDQHASPDAGTESADVESLRQALLRVREKKAALGPVNLLALQEFGSEKERLDFLDVQYADLVRGRDQLREAIRKINATARELFRDTFLRTRENFRSTFGTLFEGGQADISLADQADPLESAIEISASPRGKRVQAVTQLSGGERALTALSLLFAIYLVKPSPFCILDEVDAPLDDANIGRFLRMLKSFSDRTQFIVVTHNKRTMEAADFLYGVTMEVPGVSSLVSVDFQRRHSFDYGAIAFHGQADANGSRMEGRRGGRDAGRSIGEVPPASQAADEQEALVGD
jgi:chromosome segregation protein